MMDTMSGLALALEKFCPLIEEDDVVLVDVARLFLSCGTFNDE